MTNLTALAGTFPNDILTFNISGTFLHSNVIVFQHYTHIDKLGIYSYEIEIYLESHRKDQSNVLWMSD